MNAAAVRALLEQLRHGVGQPRVVLECHCGNLETVYVSPTETGGLLVSDSGKTFAYLGRGTDSTYQPLDELDMAAVAEACQRSGAALKRDDPEAYPSIGCEVMPAASLAEVVERVADAVDRVFQIAMRDRSPAGRG